MTRGALTVTVAAQISYAAADAPPQMTSALRERLRVPNPAYVAAARADRHTSHISEWISGVTQADGVISLPRGAMRHLREVAADHGVRLRAQDARTWPSEALHVERVTTLRDHQNQGVDALERRHQGVIVFPAGAGKTRTAIGAIAKLRTPTVIVVSSVDLAEQWCTSIRDLLGIEPGIIGGGQHDVQPVTVALVQSLVNMEPAGLDALLRRFGLLVVDECHHAASPTYRDIIDRCPARYRLGLTATPDREDGLGPMVRWQLGEVIATVKHADLIEAGHLVAAEVRELRTDYAFKYSGPDDWPKLLADLVDDPERNRVIVEAIEADARAGHTILALTGRVAHAQHLAGELNARGIEAHALVGSVAKKKRTAILDAAKAGDVQVIVATQLADEGLDIPRLSRVYQTFPAKAAGRTEQRLGRVMRPHPGVRDVAIVDVVDHRVGVLAHQARKRMAVYLRVVGRQMREAA